MHLVRSLLVVGLLVASLAGPVARAQEAAEVAGEEYAVVEPEIVVEAVAEPELLIVTEEALLAGEPIVPAEPIVMVEAAAVAPTPMPTSAVAPPQNPSPAPTPAPAAAPTKLNVNVVDNRFEPSVLTVAAGTTVTWTNQGLNLHTLTSADGLFDSGALQSGQSFTYTFEKAGSVTLLCRQHTLNGMSGRISVQ